MPRRPRPQSRKPPTHVQDQQPSAPPKLKAAASPKTRSKTEEEDKDEDEEFEDGASGSGSSSVEDEYEDEDDADADAPRVAQWVDDEELDALEADTEDSEGDGEVDEESVRPADLTRLQRDLSSLPLGTLRKAQQALAQTRHLDDGSSDEGEESDDESAPEEEASRPDTNGSKTRREIAKRANKHAPMEMSSKRPVPRKKANIEESKPVPRDPRFLHTSGAFDPSHFRSQYGFLSEMHLNELNTLKENLKRARKLLATSPRDLRQEREAEVQRLERAVKRAESTVNKDKKDKIEENALKRVRHEEKEKRKAGKGAWYMKDADKKELFTRAKFEALAEAGGRTAVRKAIEKKQRKVNQKEKKKRPFVPGEGRGPSGKRAGSGGFQSQGNRPNKRQRTS